MSECTIISVWIQAQYKYKCKTITNSVLRPFFDSFHNDASFRPKVNYTLHTIWRRSLSLSAIYASIIVTICYNYLATVLQKTEGHSNRIFCGRWALFREQLKLTSNWVKLWHIPLYNAKDWLFYYLLCRRYHATQCLRQFESFSNILPCTKAYK